VPSRTPQNSSESGDAFVRQLPVAEKKRSRQLSPQIRDAIDLLTDASGESLEAVIFFGSCLLGTSPNAASAADLIVVVRDYTRFYEDLGAQLPAARHIGIITTLNRILPPNIINLSDPAGMRAGAKCFIVSERDFKHGMSMASRDYFFRGRLSQRVEIVYARNADARVRTEDYLAMARRLTLSWVPLYLPEKFTVFEYCRSMLGVSYAGEIRPESSRRVDEVFNAQQEFFRLVYGRILDGAVAGGQLVSDGEYYQVVETPTKARRRHFRRFWRRSKARATLRWLKYMLTFDDWLDYIVHKVERRTGMRVELTQAERKAPFILLWPKVFRVIGQMKDAPPEVDSSNDRPDDTPTGRDDA